jgi:hypothetical protein
MSVISYFHQGKENSFSLSLKLIEKLRVVESSKKLLHVARSPFQSFKNIYFFSCKKLLHRNCSKVSADVVVVVVVVVVTVVFISIQVVITFTSPWIYMNLLRREKICVGRVAVRTLSTSDDANFMCTFALFTQKAKGTEL